MSTAIKKDFIVAKGIEATGSLTLGSQTITDLMDSSIVSTVLQDPTTAATITSSAKLLTKMYDSAELLPSSGNTTGDFGFVESTNRLYIWNGSGWYNIALINNTPVLTTTPDASYSMDSVGASLSITIAATDSEEIPITYSHVASDSAADLVSITQSDNVFTVSPLTQAQLDSNGLSSGGTFTITFRASDGVNIAPAVSSFTLTISSGPDWSTGSQQANFQPTDAAASDNFGISVDISEDGNYAIIGARGDDSRKGAAFIYTRSGSTWSQQAKLTASDGAANDQFGFCVGIDADGNTAVVGAPSSGNAAYIFTRSGSTWTQQKIISAPSDDGTVSSTARFGHGVYISDDGGSVFIISRGTVSSIAQHIGYVYTGSGSTWTQQGRLITSDAGSGDTEMDGAFSGDASTAVICSPGHDWGGSYSNAGAVYVFKKSGSTWSQEAKVEKSSKTANDFFGYGTDISQDGNTLVVGAYKLDNAYIFTRSGSTWSQQATITGTDTTSGDQFGRSTHLSDDGNYVAVSASYEDTAATDAGAVYVFSRDGSTWSQQKKLTTSDAESSDLIGIFENGISLSGDATTLIVGAYFEDTSGTDAGKAYVFTA